MARAPPHPGHARAIQRRGRVKDKRETLDVRDEIIRIDGHLVDITRSDSVAQGTCEIFSRFPMTLESPSWHRKRSKSGFFSELKKPCGQPPSVAQIFHS